MLQPPTVHRKSVGYDCNSKGCYGSADGSQGAAVAHLTVEIKPGIVIYSTVYGFHIRSPAAGHCDRQCKTNCRAITASNIATARIAVAGSGVNR